ncbi:MAG: hypothetical protein JETCAE03_27130 [Ignavibacteriaceae bacterium]|nr:MAG: hypothetical protein JETCAE03_27130 [Ignavibacteriaceae bacterium]
MYVDSYQKELYIKRIIKTTSRNSTTRLRGWVNNFYKIIYYKSLMLLNKAFEIKVKTFWDSRINIILPETVSINIWRNGFAESDVSIYLLKYLNKEETFIDIGAHFGFYSLLASSIVGQEGKVLSFEPTASTFNQLSKNITYSINDNIKIYNLAAFNSKTEMEFNDYGIINSSFNSFFANRGEKNLKGKKIKVKAVIADDFLKENFPDCRISLIKIDAESSEFQVLTGLKNTINKYHPKIILEVGDYPINGTKNSRDLIELVEGYGYHSFELDKTTFEIVPYITKNNESYKNILFIPD